MEIKHVMKYYNEEREKEGSKQLDVVAIGLSSRRNLCVHPTVLPNAASILDVYEILTVDRETQVSKDGERVSVDVKCRNKTAKWVRETNQGNEEALCSFYEGLESVGTDATIDPGVYTLEDLQEFAKGKNWCPYFLARRMMDAANIIVYNYQYLLDPKIANLVSKGLQKDTVVVFDEAHNIDNVCIEAMSVMVDQGVLQKSTGNLSKLTKEVENAKQKDEDALRAEFNKLVNGLSQSNNNADPNQFSVPVMPDDIVNEAIPGNIRKAQSFLSVLKRFIQHLKERLRVNKTVQESPASFLKKLYESTGAHVGGIDAKTLRFCSSLLSSLFRTLEINDMDEYTPIQLVADLATLVGTYSEGFSVIIEPHDERMPSVANPVLQLSCNDASLAISHVFEAFNSVIITSGTLSPLDLYPKILKMPRVVVSRSFPMSLTRNCISPLVVTRGSDQVPISSKFEVRDEPAVVRNYARLLIELSAVVPDGMVCFFTSYRYMEEIVATWHETKLLADICKNKLLFIETPDMVETSLALQNYRRACDSGRGAIFFSVARGKVAEGIDFDRHYGRAVVMLGVPFQYTKSNILKARLAYLEEKHQIPEEEFLTFDAIRQASQCMGRVVRSKADYGVMIFADQRYNNKSKREKLPQWVRDQMTEANSNVSTDEAIANVKAFLRDMAQPLKQEDQLGDTLLSLEHLAKRQKRAE